MNKKPFTLTTLALAGLLPLAVAAQPLNPHDSQARDAQEDTRSTFGEGSPRAGQTFRQEFGDDEFAAHDDRPRAGGSQRESRSGETMRPVPDTETGPRLLDDDGEPLSDQDITAEIRRLIEEDPDLRKERILAEADDGVVYLSGWVATPEEEQRLHEMIGEIATVDRIESELAVDPHARAQAAAQESSGPG